MTGPQRLIDLNADLGESFGAWRLGDDKALLAIVTSANIACQVSYRDLAGFGRREMTVPAEELAAEVLYQIAALDGVARAEGGRVRYVRPHGALYNRAVTDPEQAAAIASATVSYDPALPLLTLPGSALATAAADVRLPSVTEAFADRAYRDDGTLLPRSEPGAVLTDPAVVAARVVDMVVHGTVQTVSGAALEVSPRSICLHGDTPGAVELAAAVRAALEQAGVTLASFA
jgi:UPF0271 protein